MSGREPSQSATRAAACAVTPGCGQLRTWKPFASHSSEISAPTSRLIAPSTNPCGSLAASHASSHTGFTLPTYPGGGSLTLGGAQLVSGPSGGNPRYRITFPAYTGYTYEIYGNPTFADLAWSALPFSLTPTGTIDRNKHMVANDGALALYVEAKSAKGFYYVSFRVPGANTGTP